MALFLLMSVSIGNELRVLMRVRHKLYKIAYFVSMSETKNLYQWFLRFFRAKPSTTRLLLEVAGMTGVGTPSTLPILLLPFYNLKRNPY